MHIHGNSMAVNAANFYSATLEEEAAAKRAADVRKKLLKSASEVDGAATPEESLLISQWMNPKHGPVQSRAEDQEQYPASSSGRDSDFG